MSVIDKVVKKTPAGEIEKGIINAPISNKIMNNLLSCEAEFSQLLNNMI